MADRPLFVVVLPLTADTQVHAKDANVVGVYEVMADTEMSDLVSAASALEAFHIRTPVSYPENFVISVVDPHLKQVLEPDQSTRPMVVPCHKISSVVRGWLSDLVDGVPPTAATALAPTEGLSMMVAVVQLCPDDEIHEDDHGISGFYQVYGIDPTMTEMEQAESALETFHAHNGIAVLDDFEITVIDPVNRKIMDTGEECEFQEFSCWKISSDFEPWVQDLLSAPAKTSEATTESEPAAARREEDDPSPSF
jgi:hypothetical protein